METMSMETFLENTAHLSDKPATAGAIWYDWARELAEMDCPDPGIPGKPPEYFLNWIWKELQQVSEDYGETAAGNVLDLSRYGKCLFPWELYRAGEEFTLGRNMDEVFHLSIEGMLDEPREETQEPMDMAL